MYLTNENARLQLTASNYRLTLLPDRPFADLESPSGKKVASLFLFAGVHGSGGQEDTTSIGTWQVIQQSEDEIVLENTVQSSLWRRKAIRVRCQPQRFSYEIEVEGQGEITEIDYFGGYYSAEIRWGSGYFWSGQHFDCGFNPEPVTDEINTFEPSAGSQIDISGVPIPGKGSWFFTPPPYCFAFHSGENWLSMGIEAEPGNNLYSDYRYRGGLGCFALNLTYRAVVDGVRRLPAVGIDFGSDQYAVIERHCDALRQQRYAPALQSRSLPAWWRSPIFCGWGAQCYLASVDRKPAPRYSRQEHYESFLKVLEAEQVLPGMIAIDDKWQAAYGTNVVDTEKWPDLRGFVDVQHSQRRRVLLWLKFWDPEGLPPEETVQNAAGKPLACDPTNPLFERRLRASVRMMLSDDPGSYNADGFKIDFSARIPNGPGLRLHDAKIAGLELMRRYLEIIYSEAKVVKPDSLVMAHTPHPYLADVIDMIRLNDINTGKDINRAMQHRTHIARIACPQAIIDTDNWPMTDKAAWRSYMQVQGSLGVPSLYVATHIDTTQEPLLPEDYELIRSTWAAYRVAQPDLTGQSDVQPVSTPAAS